MATWAQIRLTRLIQRLTDQFSQQGGEPAAWGTGWNGADPAAIDDGGGYGAEPKSKLFVDEDGTVWEPYDGATD